MVQASCRARFTAADLGFVAERLTKSTSEGDALLRLLRDPEALDQILDADDLHRALVDGPGCVQVSPPFYFYVLARRALLRHGLDDRHLCDYVASVLAAFTDRRHLDKARPEIGSRSFGYLGDLLASIDRAPAAQAFGLRAFLADYSLFLSGIFRERVAARLHGAPGIGFYEAIGSASYRCAAGLPEASRENVRDLFEHLAEAFREIRLSLNEISSEILHLETLPGIG